MKLRDISKDQLPIHVIHQGKVKKITMIIGSSYCTDGGEWLDEDSECTIGTPTNPRTSWSGITAEDTERTLCDCGALAASTQDCPVPHYRWCRTQR